MKKNLKGAVFLGLSLLCIIVGVIFINKSLMEYAIFLFTVAFVLAVFGIGNFLYGNNPAKVYESTVKRILNTYDSILVKSSSVPRLDGKNIILVETIDDLVDAQLEIRKPICYLKQTESCSFVLLDEKEAYVYVEKVNDDVTSPIEIEIRESRIRGKNIEEMDAEMLRDIERTTIVKLSNKKSYKVSPIRKLEEFQNKQEVSSVEKESDEVKSDVSNTSNEVLEEASKEVEATEDVKTPEVSSISSNVDSEIL